MAKEAWNVPMKGEQHFLHGLINNSKGSDKAFVSLNKAVENGYNKKSDFGADEDLASLKSETRWAELMRKLDAAGEVKK